MKKRLLSLLLVFALCIGVMPATAFATNNSMPFTDLDENAYYMEAVQYVFNTGLMKGTNDGSTFEPDGTLTRSMFVTILGRFAGVADDTHVACSFGDVDSGQWYTSYVEWAKELGITNGNSASVPTFGTEDPVTRQEMATFIARFVDVMDYDLPDAEDAVDAFKDEDSVADWAVDSLELMRRSGIIKGYEDGNFGPEDYATRAEAATIFMRLCDALDIDPVDNQNLIWEKDIVYDIDHLSSSQQNMLGPIDSYLYAMNECERFDIEPPYNGNNNELVWQALYLLVVNYYDFFIESGNAKFDPPYSYISVSENKIKDCTSVLFDDYEGELPPIPSHWQDSNIKMLYKNGSYYYFGMSNRGEEYVTLSSWVEHPNGTCTVEIQLWGRGTNGIYIVEQVGKSELATNENANSIYSYTIKSIFTTYGNSHAPSINLNFA